MEEYNRNKIWKSRKIHHDIKVIKAVNEGKFGGKRNT
jgi:hypothetical protein